MALSSGHLSSVIKIWSLGSNWLLSRGLIDIHRDIVQNLIMSSSQVLRATVSKNFACGIVLWTSIILVCSNYCRFGQIGLFPGSDSFT